MRRGNFRRIVMWMTVLLSGGCGDMAGTRIVVVPIDEQAMLDGKALMLVNANTGVPDKADDTKDPNVQKCLCGGTGRSGDGLGPCACPDGCPCKPSRQEVPEQTAPEADQTPAETIEQEATKEPEPEAKEPGALKQGPELPKESEEDSIPALSVPTILGMIDSLATSSEKLANSQLGMIARVTDIDERVKALEAANVKQTSPDKLPEKVTGFNSDQAQPVLTARAVVVFQESCHPCRMMEKIFPKLEKSGWKVGTTSDCQIQHVDLLQKYDDPEVVDALSRTSQTPTTCFYKDGVFVKAIIGEMSAKHMAEEINAIVKIKPVKASLSPWVKSIPVSTPVQTRMRTRVTETVSGFRQRGSWYLTW